MESGRLRVYLGAAAGVGTTYAMLDEALRRQRRGTRVMCGCVRTYGRPFTEQLLSTLTINSGAPAELDAEAIVALGPDLRPDVVLVDELARRNPAGSPREHRWQDVELLLAQGIDVITTLSVQQIDSLADTVREIVGRVGDELVPDEFLARTDQIEIVDISPPAIRRRIAHGNVFRADDLPPDQADLFNSPAFARLRALMMFWMADRLAAGPDDLRGAHEKVMAVIAAGDGDLVLRRAARIAHRARAQLLGVQLVTTAGADPAARRRVDALGGTYREVRGDDAVEALLGVAEAERATQVVIGRGPGRRLHRPGGARLADRMIRRARDIDVHVVPVDSAGSTEHRPMPGRVPAARQAAGAVVGAALLVALTAVLVQSRGEMTVATSLALYLLAVVAITAVGGPWPGLIAAVIAPLLANWFLIPPYHTFRIADGENLLELLVFLSVAAIVSWFVSIAARRAAEAQRARTEAATLAELSSSASGDLPDVLVEQLRRTFRLEGVAVLGADVAAAGADGAGDAVPPVLARAGDAPANIASADLVAPLASGYVVAARGGPLTADEQRVLQPFLGQLSRALERQRLRQIAAESDALARADELRTALLRAVSHDLRSPLASIKASVSSLRQPDVQWAPEMRDDFLESIELETDRLTTIISNLLDMSRLEAGVLRPVLRTTSLEEVVPAAIHELGQRAKDVAIEMPPDLAEVQADPALLERVVANLVTNAVHWSPPDATVRLLAHRSGATVQLHIIDHGPGIPRHQQAAVLQPFHRLDDTGTGGGLGLGLAIADRLVAAMGGQLELRDTPGGGLTVVVALPVAPGEHP